ncbi:MAG: hypothetical protein ACK559_14555, partial [bacterium]
HGHAIQRSIGRMSQSGSSRGPGACGESRCLRAGWCGRVLMTPASVLLRRWARLRLHGAG